MPEGPFCQIGAQYILYFLHIGEHHIHPYNKYNAKQEREREKNNTETQKTNGSAGAQW